MWICQVPPVVVPESPAPTVLDPDNHGKLKKEKKEKKDKSTKKSKKDKKAKKEKKRRKEQQRTAQTQTDEEDSEFDSEWAEAKRQRCQSEHRSQRDVLLTKLQVIRHQTQQSQQLMAAPTTMKTRRQR